MSQTAGIRTVLWFCIFGTAKPKPLVFCRRFEIAPVKGQCADSTPVERAIDPGSAPEDLVFSREIVRCGNGAPWVGFSPAIRPFPDIAGHIVDPVWTATLRITADRHRSYRMRLWHVGLPWIKLISPGIEPAIGAPRRLFPFFLRGESLASPRAIVMGVVPAHEHDGMIAFPRRVCSILPVIRQSTIGGVNK